MRLNSSLVASFILAAGLSAPAFGTTFEEFGRMNNDDEAGFIAFEVQASADFLKAHGHPDQADKVIALFREPDPDGGVYRLADNLKQLYALNRKSDSQARDAGASPYLVEDAIALTLRGAGIIVPAKALLQAGDGFRPSGLPRHHIGVEDQ